MASKVEIANSALIKIGSKETIVSFDDGSPAANIAALRYDQIRLDLLRGHNWNFATSRAKLARLVDVPVFGYNYKYQLPEDWIRTTGAFYAKETPMYDFRPESGAISTDAEEVYLVYVRNVTDENEMPPDFLECISYQLAMDMAIPIAGSNTIFQLMEDRLSKALVKAKSTDSLDDSPRQLPAGSWWSARRRSGGYST